MSRDKINQEKISLNLARLKKDGNVFEIVVDPDLAILFKKGGAIDFLDVLKSQKVFSDAKKGEHSPENMLKKYFGTIDSLEIAKRIIKDGEIQVTSEYRDQKREAKRRRIVNLIHVNGIDPRTGLPHPVTRIENAFEEAKIKIDYEKEEDELVQEILRKLLPILPIRFETREIEFYINAEYAVKTISTVKNNAKILEEEWMDNGSWRCKVSIPAGQQDELFDKLNHLTHGNVESKIIRKK